MTTSSIDQTGLRTRPRGLTLLEVLVALFIFLVGICGVLAALPTGVKSAEWVILQDASIHLAHSKFSEFRRDRNEWGTLQPYSSFTQYLDARHEPVNASGDGYRDFAHGQDDAYQYFDDIDRYEWKADATPVYADTTTATPSHSGGLDLSLWRVVVSVRIRRSAREFQFTQYMYAYE